MSFACPALPLRTSFSWRPSGFLTVILFLAAFLAPPAMAAELPDSAFEALIDSQVTVSMHPDGKTSGRLVAFDADTITLILEDGEVATLDRVSLAGLSVRDGRDERVVVDVRVPGATLGMSADSFNAAAKFAQQQLAMGGRWMAFERAMYDRISFEREMELAGMDDETRTTLLQLRQNRLGFRTMGWVFRGFGTAGMVSGAVLAVLGCPTRNTSAEGAQLCWAGVGVVAAGLALSIGGSVGATVGEKQQSARMRSIIMAATSSRHRIYDARLALSVSPQGFGIGLSGRF